MNERDLAKRFQADLKTWLEKGEMPDDPDAPQPYRSTLETACSLSQAAVEADPEFHAKLEQRLQRHAWENLPRRARQTAMRLKFSSALGVGGAAVLLLALALGLSLIFNRIRPWGIGSGNTPTSEGSPTAGTLQVNETLVSQNQLSTPVPSIPIPTPLPIELQVTQSDDGLWTTYRDPDWQQSGQTITISALAIGPDGAVWASTVGESGSNGVGPTTKGAGTYRFEQGKWTRFTDNDGIPFTLAMDIASGSDGKMWFATPCCGVSSFDGKTWTTYTTASGLQTNNVWHLASAPDGALWLGTADKGAVRFDGKVWQDYTPDNSGLWGKWVRKAFVLPDGSLLFSSQQLDILPDGSLQPSNSGTLVLSTDPSNIGKLSALNRFDGQTWSQFGVPGGPPDGANDITSGPDGSLWFTTGGDGVYRLKDGAWTHFTVQDGLASVGGSRVVVSPDNVVWVGTDKGLSRYDGAHWTTYTTQDGLASDFISSLAMAPDGTLWVGTAGGISHYAPTATSLAQATMAACQTTTYVVQKGDALSKIASDFNISVGALLDYNHADPSNPGSLVLKVGDTLTIPLCAQVQALSLQSSHDLIRERMFNPTWRTIWVQGVASTVSPVGVQENTYMQAWIGRDGTGKVLSSDPLPGNPIGNATDLTSVRSVWVSDGQTITSLDLQTGQAASLAQGIMHPLDRANPVLGVIFPSFLAIRSEDLQPVRMDQQAGRTVLVADWASYRIWIDVQTGLLLRAQTRGQGGQVTSDVQITAILVDPAIPPAELSTDQLTQARFEPAPAGASSGTSILWTDQTTSVPGPIVFSASTDLGTELFSVDQQGNNITQLTHDNANNVSPVCSVDGKWIAFTSIRGGQSAIYLLVAQGGGETRLIDNPSQFVDLAFSPDGQKIAFVSEQDGNPEIYVIGIDGSGLTRLTNNPAVDDSPSWSPDGKQIAFVSSRDGPYQIYLMAADGSGQANLSNSQANDLAPAWSPDGNKIAFTSNERGADKTVSLIYVMSPDGSNVTALTAIQQGNEVRQYYNPAWSPDGKRIVFYSEYFAPDGSIRSKGILEMTSNGSGLMGVITQLIPNTENPSMDVTGRPCWLPSAAPDKVSTP